jgi:hypothetical protein
MLNATFSVECIVLDICNIQRTFQLLQIVGELDVCFHGQGQVDFQHVFGDDDGILQFFLLYV